MQRVRMISTVALAVLTAALGCATALATTIAPSRDRLRGLTCVKSLTQPMRSISVTAVMRPLKGTEKMEMEVQLLSRPGSGGAFASVNVPAQSKLDTWITPTNPTLGQRPGDVWKVHIPVAGLAAPAAYRFEVMFRWLGVHGKVIGTASRRSAGCRQPDLAPDLYVSSFTVAPAGARGLTDSYTAVVGNSGGSAAKDFEVEFSDGTKAVTDTITKLAPGASRTLHFGGPVCQASDPPTLTLDPQHTVPESNTANDTATAQCPAATTTGPAPAAPTTTIAGQASAS